MGIQRPGQTASQDKAASEPGGTSYEDVGEGSVTGNLTREPELRYTPGGRPVVGLRVASSERIQDAKTGEWRDGKTEYVDVLAWGPQAEHCVESLSKGDRIVAAGRWQKQSWTDKDGNPHSAVKLQAADVGVSLLFRLVAVDRRRNGGQQ